MKKVLIFTNIIILLCAYAPFVNQWITPSITPYWTSFALVFPITLAINIIFILIWLVYNWRFSVLFFILLIPLIGLVKPWFPFWNSESKEDADLSFMTYNVRYFYDDFSGIVNLTKENAPDIVFLQEMGTRGEDFINELNQNYQYFFENHNSLGIASTYPIIESNHIDYKNYPLTMVYGDIALPNDTIRLINIYLESLHLDQEELKQAPVNSSNAIEKSTMLLTKVAKAAKVHQEQIELIQNFVKKSPHPIILGGDFNAVPTSFEYYKLKEGLVDAFPMVGNQLGNTFRSLKIPLKLDYVFSTDNIQATSYKILKVDYSDHYPTFVKFKLSLKE